MTVGIGGPSGSGKTRYVYLHHYVGGCPFFCLYSPNCGFVLEIKVEIWKSLKWESKLKFVYLHHYILYICICVFPLCSSIRNLEMYTRAKERREIKKDPDGPMCLEREYITKNVNVINNRELPKLENVAKY